jgi:hypothetical protein
MLFIIDIYSTSAMASLALAAAFAFFVFEGALGVDRG